jgi:hypothetical protein
MKSSSTAILTLLVFSFEALAVEDSSRWTADKANAWYEEQPWLVGCNFIPSSAINQLEMWQEDTFNPETIDRELGWASGIGLNSVRVYLHDLAWQAAPDGLKKRIERYLEIAESHGISTVFVLFDDCWNEDPRIGPQPTPIPGVHNSGWLQSPGKEVVNSPESWETLERYVKDVVGSFAKDKRIVFWDLYNEPGNSGQGPKSLPLLKKTFEWAREAGPTQPLTAGLWFDNKELNDFQIEASDIITFHNYNDIESLTAQVHDLKKHGRPVICTEWLRRNEGSVFASHLPFFRTERVGCYNWGLVTGKTQTMYPWGSKEGAPEPEVWFHDLLRKDGTPFDPEEIAMIGAMREK